MLSPYSFLNHWLTWCLCCGCGGMNKKKQRLFLLSPLWAFGQLFIFCVCQIYWESIEWGNKKKYCFAWDRCELTLEKGLWAHLGRELDLPRLEGPRGGGFCGDQCTSLIGWPCEYLGTWHSHYCLSGVAEVSMVKLATVGMSTANWSDFHLDH